MSTFQTSDPKPSILDRGFFALDDYISVLRAGEEPPDIPLHEEHELATALYALRARRLGNVPPELAFKTLETGALPLFEKGRFPWGALPYPRDHALLITALQELGEQELASKMLHWQALTIDHRGAPLLSLLNQEGTLSARDLDAAYHPLSLPEVGDTLLDPQLGMLGWRTSERTLMTLATGCKTTLGLYLHGDAGVIAYGPQTTPLGNTSGFGLAGKPESLEMTSHGIAYRTRLAAPHPRRTGLPYLKDSGYSGLWLDAKTQRDDQTLTTSCRLVGCRPAKHVLFSIFGKGEQCVVAGTHRLRPRSLDRYEGPAQRVAFQGNAGAVYVDLPQSLSMEVIPLGGNNAFWGADFLMSFAFPESSLDVRFTS